jgi:hypothetical protein
VSGAFIVDYGGLVDGATYFFSIPNVLDAVSANYWTQKHLQDLGIAIAPKSKEEFMMLLMKEEATVDPTRENYLIESLKSVSETFLDKFESKHHSEEDSIALRTDQTMQHPIIKALFLVRKYSNLESGVDAFVQLLLFYLGFFEQMLFPFPQLKLPLLFGDVEKDAIADFVVLDILSFFRMAVIEDKILDRHHVDSEAQMVGEAIASCQQNNKIVGPAAKKQRTNISTVPNDEIFGVRVSGTFFHFYIIPVSPAVLGAMESKKATNVHTEIIKYESILNFIEESHRETIIRFLSAMRTVISRQGASRGRFPST